MSERIPEGWKRVRLGEVINSANTGLDAIKKAAIVTYNSGIKCLRIQDISQHKEFNEWGFCEVASKNYEKFQIKKDDIFIARTGASIGTNLYIKENLKAVYNNGLIRLRADRIKCDSKYLYYNFQSREYKGFIRGISDGTSTQPNMQINVLLSFEFLLPPLPEQRSIASVLSSLDDKIDLLHRQNKTLEVMAEALFRKWFIEEAKEEWEEGVLGDLINLNYGKGLKKEVRTGHGFPVIGSNGVVDYHSEYLVNGPGIVIGRKGTLGKVIYVWENFHPIDTTFYVESKNNSRKLFFEYFLLKGINFEDMNSDSAVPGLNRDIALSTEIIIPPKKVIELFTKRVEPMFDKIFTNTKQIRTLEKLRDTLLSKLMSGQVRVRY